MVGIAEIVDRESFKVWLEQENLPRPAMVALASRAALRVFPLWWAEFGLKADHPKRDLHSLSVCRLLLTSASYAIAEGADVSAKLATAATAADAATYASAYDSADATSADAAAYAAADATAAANDAATADATADAANDAANADANADAAWSTLRLDCNGIATPRAVLSAPLWPDRNNPLLKQWQDTKVHFAGLSDHPWAFWLDWYQRLLDGTEDRWDLLTDIALLDKDADGNDLWQDPEKLAAEIARLEAEYAAKQEPQPVSTQLAKMPPPSETTVAQVKTAMERHRRDLPPTFDALTGYLSLEIERLQNRNYRGEDDREESERQIRVLLTIAEAVEKLQALVPASGEMPQEDAVEATKLGQLYVQKFKEWPREHAGDLVDSSFRMALVGGTTVLLPMIGITQPIAFAAGLVLFGGKKMTEAVKAAKEAMS